MGLDGAWCLCGDASLRGGIRPADIQVPNQRGAGAVSNRKSRHLAREPLEHQVQGAVEDLVGQDGTVYVERSGEGPLDSILVQVVLRDAKAPEKEARHAT